MNHVQDVLSVTCNLTAQSQKLCPGGPSFVEPDHTRVRAGENKPVKRVLSLGTLAYWGQSKKDCLCDVKIWRIARVAIDIPVRLRHPPESPRRADSATVTCDERRTPEKKYRYDGGLQRRLVFESSRKVLR